MAGIVIYLIGTVFFGALLVASMVFVVKNRGENEAD